VREVLGDLKRLQAAAPSPARACCSVHACCVAAHRSASPAPKHHATAAGAHTARSGTAPTAALRAWTQTGCWRAQTPTLGEAAELARSAAVPCHAISAVRQSLTRSSLTAAAAMKTAVTTNPPIMRFCAAWLFRCWVYSHAVALRPGSPAR